MPVAALLLPLLAAAAPDRPIVVTAYAGRPFISPMGEPFRAKSSVDDALARWFGQADRNQDGLIDATEMQADAARFFARLDGDEDGEIDPEELIRYEWEVAPEIQVNSRTRRSRSATVKREPPPLSDGDVPLPRRHPTTWIDEGLQGAARYALLNIPEPVAAADANLDRSITLGEFERAAVERFQYLDQSRLGKVSLAGLKALLPVEGKRPKISKESDPRLGVPLPPGD